MSFAPTYKGNQVSVELVYCHLIVCVSSNILVKAQQFG